jgi:hypothetical protein
MTRVCAPFHPTRIWRKTFEELSEPYNADSRIRHFTSRHFGEIFQTRIMSKTVRVHDPAIGKIHTIPATLAGPAPGNYSVCWSPVRPQ